MNFASENLIGDVDCVERGRGPGGGVDKVVILDHQGLYFCKRLMRRCWLWLMQC